MGDTESQSDQTGPGSIAFFLAPLTALQNLLQEFDEQGVIIGGIATSLLGEPRYTVDLDAVFLLGFRDLPRLLSEAAKQGIEPRIADPIAFARRSNVVLLRHAPSGTDIDLSLGMLPFETEMVERSTLFEVGSIRVRLPSPEDLIIMKAVAHRPKDLEDIRAVAGSYPHLDKKRIQFWVEQFGEALDLPDLWKIIAQLL